MTVARRRKKLSLLFLLLLTAVTLYLSFVIAEPFLTPILTATLLAVAIYPLFRRMSRYLRNPSVAALVGTLLVVVAIVLPAVLLVNRLAHETTALYSWLNERQSVEGGWSQYLGSLLDPPLQAVAERTGLSQEQLRQAALGGLRNLSTSLLSWAKSMAVNISGTVVNTVIMLLTLFFLLRDGEKIRHRIGALLPLEPHRYDQLVDTISASIAANMYGVLAVAVAQGTLGAIGYTIAGLPSVVLWSVATATFSMIPLAGAAAVWVTACLYLVAIGDWGRATFMAVWGAAVISTADNIVRPLVLSGKVELHTLLIFFSLLGGVKAFGIIGLFVGPIIVSVAMALLKILEDERGNWEGRTSVVASPSLTSEPESLSGTGRDN